MPTDHPTDLDLTQTGEETDTAQSATTSVAEEARSVNSSEDGTTDTGSPVSTMPEQTNASNGSPEPSVSAGTAEDASTPDASVDGDAESADASTITEIGATAEAEAQAIEAAPESFAEVATEATPDASVTSQAEDDSDEIPEGANHKLIREVQHAPHKVYLLGKVRKAVAAAGDSELSIYLKTVQADILYQVDERKTAKEALCERAEALKDSTSWKATGDAFKALFEDWKLVGAAGRELDDQLWARFNLARGNFNERRAKHFEEREQVWTANREKKEELCTRAEELSDSTNWKATAEAIRDLQAQWKSVGSAGREKDDALWARFNEAKQQFFDRRGAVWDENRKRKEALVSDAEALKDSTDWRTAGDALKAMQAEWKSVGPAGREHEDELWTRFRAATQSFFDRRSSTFADRNRSERENLVKKQELCQRAEALAYTGDSLAAAREAKDLQAQWKETGPVPREQSDALWARFRQACDKIFENASGERDRQQNEWHTRMREAMGRKREQLNSLRESISHDEANIERWRESLSTLKPGGKADEIGTSLENKILDVMDRIRGKQERVEDLRSSINDIEAKLKE